jgi:HlyD family secretion protein
MAFRIAARSTGDIGIKRKNNLMDRPIEKKKWTRTWIAIVAMVGLGGLTTISMVFGTPRRTRLTIDESRLRVAQVRQQEFQEYAAITGRAQPNKTTYLDLQEGGIVEKIYVHSGDLVKKGDSILLFSNNTAQKENIDAETRLLDNLNQLRNSKISLTQSNLILKDQLLDVEKKISDAQVKFNRYQQLMSGPTPFLSNEAFITAHDELGYYKNKRDLLQERIRQETILEKQQSKQIDSSMASVNRDMEVLSEIIASLNVRAPADGQLSTLNVEIGQSIQRWQRVGQIDELGSFMVRADIDQYYISKVAIGQKGKFEFDNRAYELKVSKIYPEVKNNVFQADLTFVGAVPEGLKRGQDLQIDLSLSEAKMTDVVEKGGFYRHTNGRWAYLLSADRRSARRRNLVLGRQNPQSVEVLEGLKVGDKIIVSDYDNFGDVDELSFKEPLKQ